MNCACFSKENTRIHKKVKFMNFPFRSLFFWFGLPGRLLTLHGSTTEGVLHHGPVISYGIAHNVDEIPLFKLRGGGGHRTSNSHVGGERVLRPISTLRHPKCLPSSLQHESRTQRKLFRKNCYYDFICWVDFVGWIFLL